MPQMSLPIFPPEITLINPNVGYIKKDGQVWYFNGQMPLFFHQENDEDSFRMFMAQLHVMGVATQAEINKTFGFNPINMKRWVKKYRKHGPGAFFTKTRKRNPRVLVPKILGKAQDLLSDGKTPGEIEKEIGVKADTIRKAISSGKLHRPSPSSKKKIKVPK